MPNHPRIAAEILRPYVRDEVFKMILVHQDFQGRHYYHHFGGDPAAREKHRETLDRRGVRARGQFADEWDQIAFDPDYDTLPLEHFEPLAREVFATPHMLLLAATRNRRRRLHHRHRPRRRSRCLPSPRVSTAWCRRSRPRSR